MTQRMFTDRTRIVERERCPRRRWLQFHEAGTGIVPKKVSLPLVVGGAVHAGLADLLRDGQKLYDASPDAWDLNPKALEWLENRAVEAALADFALRAQDGSSIELDAPETAAMQPTAEAIWQTGQLKAQAAELGMSTEGLGLDREQSRSEFDRYLWAEQSALVEALVRAYARRRLRPLLEQFEVLEVEREGEWKMYEWNGGELEAKCNCGFDPDSSIGHTGKCAKWQHYELWFMSRPDAILRERQSNELYLLSFKTAANWGDVRKARDIERDMQGLSEGVEVERRLGEWWQFQKDTKTLAVVVKGQDVSKRMAEFLWELPAPPRIHAIRYEFLLKGERWEDKELSARLGMTVRTQRSHLIRQYVAVSVPQRGTSDYRVGDICWSWEFYRPEDNRDSKLSGVNWKGVSLVDVSDTYERLKDVSSVYLNASPIKEWIDALDSTELLMSGEDSTVGLEPRPLGYRSRAQAMGVTREHPLDAVFVQPIVVFRQDDDLRDWYDQTVEEEKRNAEGVAVVNAATDEGERRHLMNQYFPMYRHSCSYPSICIFDKVCYGGPDAKSNPMGTGQFAARVPNHPVELTTINGGRGESK